MVISTSTPAHRPRIYASKITHYTIGSFLAHRSPVLFLPQEAAMLLVSMNVVHVLLVTIDNHGVIVRC